MAIRMTKYGPQSYKDEPFQKPSTYIEPTPKTPDIIIPEGTNSAAEYIRNREKLAAYTGATSKQAGFSMIAGEQALTEAALKERAAQKALEEGAPLAEKQAEELAAIDALKVNQTPLTTAERNAAAGQAFKESIAANLGISSELASLVSPLSNVPIVQQAIGVIATTSIAGISLSTLFNPASGNIKNLQGDISDNVAEARRITMAATSKGANVQQAIQSLNLLEESTRFKYNAAEKSLSESPKDVREGLDLVDEMSRNLRSIVENRQALERYALTGDANAVLSYLGTDTTSQ
jgi:hypothetical protein